jgi:hypothetical protein
MVICNTLNTRSQREYRLVVNTGTAELMNHEIKVFSDRMGGVEGNKIEYVETRCAPHDVLLNCWFTEPIAETKHVIARTGRFLNTDRKM